MVADDDRDRRVVSGIENGVRTGDMMTVREPRVRRLLDGWNGRGLRTIEQQIAELRERRNLLEERLPTEEEVAVAEEQAAELVKRATGQSEQFTELWSAFMVALTQAESAGREVVATRTEAQSIIGELIELRDHYALEVEVPREPQPDPGESKLAGVLGLLLKDVGYSQVIDRQLDVELHNDPAARTGGESLT